MPNAIPIRVPGTGGSTLQYVLPANMMQFVQSVNAVIDNSGGADAKPILTVLDSTSEVIADVPQGRSIPAGDSGRATWALRLADESDGGGHVALKSEKFLNPAQDTIAPSSDAFLTWVHNDGDSLLDLTAPKSPTMIAAGVYAFTMSVEIQPDAAPIADGALFTGIMETFPPFAVESAVGQFTYSTVASITTVATATLVCPVPAGTLCRFDALSTFTSSVKARLFGRVQQVG